MTEHAGPDEAATAAPAAKAPAPAPRFAPALPPRLDPKHLSATQADWLVRLATDNPAGRLSIYAEHNGPALSALVGKGLAVKDAQGWQITAAGLERCKSIY